MVRQPLNQRLTAREGLDLLDKCIDIDQSPIGRTPVPILLPILVFLRRSASYLLAPKKLVHVAINLTIQL